MTIANDLSALSEHMLLTVFVINPVLISWLELQLGFPLAYLLHSNEFEFELLHNALSKFFLRFLRDCWPASFWTCDSHFGLYAR